MCIYGLSQVMCDLVEIFDRFYKETDNVLLFIEHSQVTNHFNIYALSVTWELNISQKNVLLQLCHIKGHILYFTTLRICI